MIRKDIVMSYNEKFNELRLDCDIIFFKELLDMYVKYVSGIDVHDGSLTFNEFLKNALYDGASSMCSIED